VLGGREGSSTDARSSFGGFKTHLSPPGPTTTQNRRKKILTRRRQRLTLTIRKRWSAQVFRRGEKDKDRSGEDCGGQEGEGPDSPWWLKMDDGREGRGKVIGSGQVRGDFFREES